LVEISPNCVVAIPIERVILDGARKVLQKFFADRIFLLRYAKQGSFVVLEKRKEGRVDLFVDAKFQNYNSIPLSKHVLEIRTLYTVVVQLLLSKPYLAEW
jgi:hypothetical protein